MQTTTAPLVRRDTWRQPWRSTMTDRERFVRQMHFKAVDRCFNMEFGYWNENFDQWAIFQRHGITNNDQAHRFFGMDKFDAVGGMCWLNPLFEKRVVEMRGDRQVIMNEEGLLAEIPRDGHDTIPHYVKASVQTPDDWKRCKQERLRLDDPARRVDVEKLKRMHPANRSYPLGVDCGSLLGKIRNLLTFEGLAYAVYDYPEMVEDMVETLCRLIEHFLDQVLPHVRFDFAAGWEDICFKSGPIVSVDFFKQVLVPRYVRLGRKLRAAGIDVWYTDCDGDIRPLIPGFLEAGLNCLFPFEVNGCGHPGEVLAAYPGALRVMGGFDKLELRKGKAAIRAYMQSLAPWVARGGFIPFCDHRCPPDVDPDDYLYYLDLKEHMFGMG